jgi:hypothetical protein
MSGRSYKQGIIDDVNDLSAGADLTNTERLSGADLEQLRQAARAGAAATFDGTTKVVGTNARYPGTPSNAALTGADVESSTGTL